MLNIFKIVKEKAEKYELDPLLILCIICQESNGNQYAFRVEWERITRRFTYPLTGFKPDIGVTRITERVLRSCSFGYMQILGDTARDFGYKDLYLTSLFEAGTNIDLGCRIFKKYYLDKNMDVTKTLLRYNGGGNLQYPKEVLAKKDSLIFQRLKNAE